MIPKDWSMFVDKITNGYNYINEYTSNDSYVNMRKRLTFLRANKIQPTSHHWNFSLSGDSFLYGMVLELKPKIVIETGVAFGNSSYCILSAMNKNGFGTLYSIDIQPGQYTGYVVPDELRQNWNLILGKSSKVVIPELFSQLSSIDMFFHDSVHTTDFMLWEYEQAWCKLVNGGILSSHDVNSGQGLEAFKQFTEKYHCPGIRPKTSKIRNQIGFIYKE